MLGVAVAALVVLWLGRPEWARTGAPRALAPWYATAPTSPNDRRREFEDQHSRLLSQAVGDHLPCELALRAAELAAQLERRA